MKEDISLYSKVVYTKEEFLWRIDAMLRVTPNELSKNAIAFYQHYMEWARDLPDDAKIAFLGLGSGIYVPYEFGGPEPAYL